MTDPAAALVGGLVERAALDGCTCVPAAVVAAALRGRGVHTPGPAAEAAVEAELVTAYLDERLFGHPRWAPLEEQVAEAVVERVTRGGPEALQVVVAPRGIRQPEQPDDAVVVPAAHGLGLVEAAEVLDRVAEAPGPLVLVGDPAMPYAPGPGRVLADLVASAAVPVTDAPVTDAAGTDGGALAGWVRELRAGRLPVVDPDTREVVVTPAAEPDEAVRRVVQLVSSSIPRVLGVAAADTVVVTPREDGRAGARTLRAALDAADAAGTRVVGGPELRAPAAAVVLVLPAESAGSVTRSLLVGAATLAERHLSVVHQAGPAVAEAVARRPHPPRRTRLVSLLAEALA